MSRAVCRWLLLLLSLCAQPLWAAADREVRPRPQTLTAQALPATVKLGEPFSVEITITHEPQQRYELKTPGDLGDLDYLGQERARRDGASNSTTTLRAKLSAFALGETPIASLVLEVSTPDGTFELPVPPTTVKVVSSLPADTASGGADLYDVREPEEALIRTWRLLFALAGLLALGLAAWALWKYWKRPRAAVAAPAAVLEPLDVRTARALDALAKENWPAQGRFKDFYFRLSEILRAYLGERYGFEALECTTPELLDSLRSRPTPGLPMDDLRSFAQLSDFARYAKAQPSADDCKAHLELGYRLVQLTRPAPSPPASVAN